MQKILNHDNIYFHHSGGAQFEWMSETSFLADVFSILEEMMKEEKTGFSDYLFFVFSQQGKDDIPECAFLKTDKKKVLIIISEESESIPYNLSPYFFAIFKCYMQFDKFCVKNIFNFPLGCGNTVPPPTLISPVAERPYSVFFSGALHTGRAGLYSALFLKNGSKFIRRALNYMIKRPFLNRVLLFLKSNFSPYFDASYIKFTGGFRQGLGGAVYGSMINKSKIAFCPRGCRAAECFRHYEAMRAGCIIISAKLPKIHFYKDSPIIQIDDWQEGLKIAGALFAVGFNTPPLGAVKLWQRLEFMVVNPTRTKNFLYKKKYPALQGGVFFIKGRKQNGGTKPADTRLVGKSMLPKSHRRIYAQMYQFIVVRRIIVVLSSLGSMPA